MPTAAPEYAIRDSPEKHRFELDLGDGSFAIAEYTLPAGKIVFTHTEVPPAHEGQGIGSALIRFALASAREHGLQVIPICRSSPPASRSTRESWTCPIPLTARRSGSTDAATPAPAKSYRCCS